MTLQRWAIPHLYTCAGSQGPIPPEQFPAISLRLLREAAQRGEIFRVSSTTTCAANVSSWQANASKIDCGPFAKKYRYFFCVLMGVFKHFVCAGIYTSFMYITNSTEVTWPALEAWARDQGLLEPLGFMRGFYRTGTAPWSGRTVMVDARQKVRTALWTQGSREHFHYLGSLDTF